MKKIIIICLLHHFIATEDITDEFKNQIIDQEITRSEIIQTSSDKKYPTIWTKPLIIDSNNHDFDDQNSIKFDNNVIYKPAANYIYPVIYANYAAAIIVNKDNITIDLSGYNFSFHPPATSNFMINNPTYGIAVYPGVKNLRIISTNPNGNNERTHQGSITNFTGYAIFASGSRQSYNSYDIYALMIKNLLIDNLLITQNTNGIYLENCFNPTISNCNIIYNYSSRTTHGIYFSYVLNGLIDQCQINQNLSYTDVYGVLLEDTSNVMVRNSSMNANQSIRTGSARGLSLNASLASPASYDNTIINCTAHRNLCANAEHQTSIGFHISHLSRINTIQNCSSSHSGYSQLSHNAMPPTTPPTSFGFFIDGSNFNTITGNTASYHASAGFFDAALASTSFYTSNIGSFCGPEYKGPNFVVSVPNSSTQVGPLQTTNLYANDVSAFTGSGPQLVNLSITPFS